MLLYELLNEIVDNGLIQECEPELIKEYIMSDFKKMMKVNKQLEVPKHIDSKVNWRKENIRHYENEIYFEVVENFYFF